MSEGCADKIDSKPNREGFFSPIFTLILTEEYFFFHQFGTLHLMPDASISGTLLSKV